MIVVNFGVCFGFILMRVEEESVAVIMDIKFLNIIVEIFINNYEKVGFCCIWNNFIISKSYYFLCI